MKRLMWPGVVAVLLSAGCSDSTLGPSDLPPSDAPFRAELTTVRGVSNNVSPCPTPCPASASGTQTASSPCCPDNTRPRAPRYPGGRY